MSALVRRHADGGNGGAVINALRKVYDVAARVVVIGQLAVYHIHLHIAQPMVVQDLSCDLGGGTAARTQYLGVSGISG